MEQLCPAKVRNVPLLRLGASQRERPQRRVRWGLFLGFAKSHALAYLRAMYEFCLPTTTKAVPTGPDYIHEIKYDGYRLMVARSDDRVRLITKGGYDWTKRFPWIVEAALKNRHKQFVIDGEAVILGVDGYSDFNALHSGKHNEGVKLCAFDVLAIDGADLRNSAPLDAQGKSSAASGTPAGWDLPQ